MRASRWLKQLYEIERELLKSSLAMLMNLPRVALTGDQVGHMAHKDVDSLTLLFTSSPGLQVFAKSSWIPVRPHLGSIVVAMDYGLEELGF